MSDRNRDPGAPLDSQGVPDVADDSTPERAKVPEPQRMPTPTEAPVVSTDYGTTAAEQRAGEPLERKLAREEPERDPAEDPDSPVGPRYHAADVEPARPPEDDLSPYELEIPPAERDLAQHEQP